MAVFVLNDVYVGHPIGHVVKSLLLEFDNLWLPTLDLLSHLAFEFVFCK